MSFKNMGKAAGKIAAKQGTSLESFVVGNERDKEMSPDTLKSLTLEELALRFKQIEKQSHLFLGRILLEARTRFPSDKEFGAWVIENGLDSVSQQHRTRLLAVAKFFDDDVRPLDGISITSAYEISAPKYASVAEKAYEEIRGKNLSANEVRKVLSKFVEPIAQELREEIAVKEEPKTTKRIESDERISLAELVRQHNPVIEHKEENEEILLKYEQDIEDMTLEEQILYRVLGGMPNEKKLTILENCKDFILNQGM